MGLLCGKNEFCRRQMLVSPVFILRFVHLALSLQQNAKTGCGSTIKRKASYWTLATFGAFASFIFAYIGYKILKL